MKTLILSIFAVLFALPAHAQLKVLSQGTKAASKASARASQQLTRQVSAVARNAQAFTTGMTLSPTKRILNQHTQFQREYKRAAALYSRLQPGATVIPETLRAEINNTIINNTLKNTLLENMELGFISGMSLELEQYFNLADNFPVFSTSAGPDEAFAQAAKGYLTAHPHKPSWHLREIIKFGGMRAIKAGLSRALENYPLDAVAEFNGMTAEETKELLALYERAEILNERIKQFIAKDSFTLQDHEDILHTLREMHGLYAELLDFARNCRSVKFTLTIYQNLLNDMEAFIAVHHRAPLWQNTEERPLYTLFEPLVLGNKANQFEEIIPILTKLYAITETFPVKRLSERDALKNIQDFFNKEGFVPRSVQSREFFDTRTDEPMLFEAMTYWKKNSPAFAREIDKLVFPEENNFPPFF